jgi:hypothetical protein
MLTGKKLSIARQARSLPASNSAPAVVTVIESCSMALHWNARVLKRTFRKAGQENAGRNRRFHPLAAFKVD